MNLQLNKRQPPTQMIKDCDLRVATWNIRTMLQPGKMEEIANELLRYNVDVAALQEIRWREHGEIRKQHYSIYYSGPQKQGNSGTGFYVTKTIRNSIMAFEPVSDRICCLRLKGKFQNISLFSVYAPTEDSDDELKDDFYDRLTTAVSKISRHDIIIILGDFNSQIGKEDYVVGKVAGRYSLHTNTNKNGLRLCNFASANGLWISSTSFNHRNIHKQTWKIPGRNDYNQIDHILIDKRHATSITDTRSYRGANCDSDHFLVLAKLHQRLSTLNTNNKYRRKNWKTETIINDETTRKKYQNTLAFKIDNLRVEGNINERWNNFKECINEAAAITIGTKKAITNEWFDDSCKKANEAKNEARQLYLANHTQENEISYIEKRKNAKKLIKKRKKIFMKDKVKEIENNYNQNAPRNMYLNIKKQTKNYQPRTNICKDKYGNTLSDKNEIVDRWREYFDELLNKPNVTCDGTAPNIIEIDEETPTVDDTKAALQKLKNFKCSGEDGIVAELFKYAGDKCLNYIHQILVDVWQTETLPNEWLTSVILPIHKKGDKTNCNNYRGISLLNCGYKIFTNILYERLNKYAENILGDYQCGFRKSRSTTDQGFIITQIFEKCYEYMIDIHCLFVDFQQAFDSLDRTQISLRLLDLGIPRKLVNLVNMTLVNTNAKVIIQGELSRTFDVVSGVKQGDALSSLVFNLVLHSVVKDIDQKSTIYNKSTQICAYADDILIIARNKDILKNTFKKLKETAQTTGLEINRVKTKYMLRSYKHQHVPNLIIDDTVYESVKEFKYLGIYLSSHGDTTVAIQDRIQSANRTWFLHLNLFKSSLLSKKLKLSLYRTLIRPVLTYGCEIWTLKTSDINQLHCFERRILRKIFGPIEVDQGVYRSRYNHELEILNENQTIIRFIKAQRLRWFGHVLRMDDNTTVKKAFDQQPEGKRKRGHPRKRWKDDIMEDLKTIGVKNYKEKAKNRELWRNLVAEAMVHKGL